MAGFLQLSAVTQALSFHGHKLLRSLATEHPGDLQSLDLQNLDYRINQARLPEVQKVGSLHIDELINFISNKFTKVYIEQPYKDPSPEYIEGYKYQDKYDNLPPLEYYMKVDASVRKYQFFKNIKRGDLLFGKVIGKREMEMVHVLCILSTDAGKHRDLINTDIKAVLKMEDTIVDKIDKDETGFWMNKTILHVEVLMVQPDKKYLIVGTKGVTLSSDMKQKVELGKSRFRKDRPEIIYDMQEQNVQSFSHCLNKIYAFSNPQSIKLMSGLFGFSLTSHTSLMNSLSGSFPEGEMYKSLRKAQMGRWAHKSVADGVAYFKKGSRDEAFQCLNRALQIDEENVEAFVAKGALLANLGRYEKAVEDFESALKFDPKHNNARKYICETLFELGKILENDGKLEEAEDKFKKCLEVDPEHEKAIKAVHNLNRKLCKISEPSTSTVQSVLKDVIEQEEEHNLNRSLCKISEPSTSTVQSVLRDVIEQEEEQLRKKQLLTNTKSMNGPSSTTDSQDQCPSIGNTASTILNSHLKCPQAPRNLFNYPPPQIVPPTVPSLTTIVPAYTGMPIAPMFSQPPPGYPLLDTGQCASSAPFGPAVPPPPSAAAAAAVAAKAKRDQDYKMQVENFLKKVGSSTILQGKSDQHESNETSRNSKKNSRGPRKRTKLSRSRSESSSSSSSCSSSSSQSSTSSRSSSSSKSEKHKINNKKKTDKKKRQLHSKKDRQYSKEKSRKSEKEKSNRKEEKPLKKESGNAETIESSG